MAVFDEGLGPQLFAWPAISHGSESPALDGWGPSVAANYVATWDGTSWTDGGAGLLPTYPASYWLRFSVFDERGIPQLYLWEYGGYQIWQRVGGAWESLILPEEAYDLQSLAVFDDGTGPHLYVAAGGIGIEKESGGSWTQVLAPDNEEKSIAAFSDADGSFLYAAGAFPNLSGGDYTPRLRRWNGSAWSGALADAAEIARVDGLGPDPVLFRTSPLARWENGVWVDEPTVSDVVDPVTSVAFASTPTSGSVLFAGPSRVGSLQLGGKIGRWDGTDVYPATTGLPGGSRVAQSHDGLRWHTYGIDEAIGQVAEWNGEGWTLLGAALGVPIHDVAWIDLGSGPQLFAAGDGVFRRFQGTWISIDGPSGVKAIVSFQGSLFAGGSFTQVNGGQALRLARWNGTAWQSAGGFDDDVLDLTVTGGLLHVAGTFSHLGVTARYGYVAFDGTSWRDGDHGYCGLLKGRYLVDQQGYLEHGTLSSLAHFDDGTGDKLVLGGDFAADCTHNLWTARLPYVNLSLGGGVDGPPVLALATGIWRGSPAVVAGGGFGEADGVRAGRLAIWHSAPDGATCASSGRPPVITVTSPPAPLTNQTSATVAGNLDEPGTLTLDGTPVAVAGDLTFSFPSGALSEGANDFYLEATNSTNLSSHLRYTLIRDSVAPTIDFIAPPAGARVYTATPTLDLALGDGTGSGIDSATLEVAINGAPLPASDCVVRESAARCRPSSPLPGGPAALTARVADRAGNLSAIANLSITVDLGLGSTSTTVVGVVHLPAGTPAPGANVRVLGRSGVVTTTLADGTFSLPVEGVESDATLQLVADSYQGSQALMAVSAHLTPVPGGVTDSGVLTLRAACDLAASPGLSGSIGVGGKVTAAAVYDDGSGSALYLGGSSLLASGSTYGLIRWNGDAWVGIAGAPAYTIRALTAYDDGSGPDLYVGGSFTTAGGIAVKGLARWNGSAWSDVGGGVTWEALSSGVCTASAGSVYAFQVLDEGSGPALYRRRQLHQSRWHDPFRDGRALDRRRLDRLRRTRGLLLDRRRCGDPEDLRAGRLRRRQRPGALCRRLLLRHRRRARARRREARRRRLDAARQRHRPGRLGRRPALDGQRLGRLRQRRGPGAGCGRPVQPRRRRGRRQEQRRALEWYPLGASGRRLGHRLHNAPDSGRHPGSERLRRWQRSRPLRARKSLWGRRHSDPWPAGTAPPGFPPAARSRIRAKAAPCCSPGRVSWSPAATSRPPRGGRFTTSPTGTGSAGSPSAGASTAQSTLWLCSTTAPDPLSTSAAPSCRTAT